MKKIVTIFLILLMSFTMLVIPVKAANEANVSITTNVTEIKQGDTIVYTISIKDITTELGIAYMEGVINYDEDVFDVTTEKLKLQDDDWARTYDSQTKRFTAYSPVNAKSDIDLFTLTLTAKSNATLGNTTVSVKNIILQNEKDSVGKITVPDTSKVIEIKSSKVETVKPIVTVTKNENTVTITSSNVQLNAKTGWTLSQDKMSLSKTYNETTKETITVTSIDGVLSDPISIDITVNTPSVVDVTKPVGTVSYNQSETNVIVTVNANEEIQSLTGWTLAQDKKSISKTYTKDTTETIKIKDLAGNESNSITIEAKLLTSKSDTTKPIVTVSYSNKTTSGVLATISANEEIQALTGWTLSADRKALSKTYNKATEETIKIKDLAGNETEVKIKAELATSDRETGNNTSSDKPIPKAGIEDYIVPMIVVFAVCGIGTFVRFRKMEH